MSLAVQILTDTLLSGAGLRPQTRGASAEKLIGPGSQREPGIDMLLCLIWAS